MSFFKALRFQRLSFHYSDSKTPQETDIRAIIMIFIGKTPQGEARVTFEIAKQINASTLAEILCSHHTILKSSGSSEKSVLWGSHCHD